MSDFYREIILDHYRNPRNFGNIKKPTHSLRDENVSCGDKIAMQVIVKDGKVSKIAFSGNSCAISTASASLLTEYVKGKSVEDIMKIKRKDMNKLVGIEPTPARVKCLLLPLEVLQKMIKKI